MPRSYKRQGELETLAAKTGITSNYVSDHRQVLFGGRTFYDQLQYFRNQNTDSIGVNDKLPDAFVKFGAANGADDSSRADQIEHNFYDYGAYP